jgi:hypothetical protein
MSTLRDPEGLDERRPQGVARSEHTPIDGRALLAKAEEQVAVGLLVRLAARAVLPGPPMVGVGLAVERPAAGDRDVLLLERVHERRVVHQLDALPSREHGRVAAGSVLKRSVAPAGTCSSTWLLRRIGR